jgi:hypothetical protein
VQLMGCTVATHRKIGISLQDISLQEPYQPLAFGLGDPPLHDMQLEKNIN